MRGQSNCEQDELGLSINEGNLDQEFLPDSFMGSNPPKLQKINEKVSRKGKQLILFLLVISCLDHRLIILSNVMPNP